MPAFSSRLLTKNVKVRGEGFDNGVLRSSGLKSGAARFVLFNKYYLEDQIEANEMGRVRGTYGRNGNAYSVLVAKPEG